MKSIFVSMLAVAALVGCNKDDAPGAGTTGGEEAKNLLIQFNVAPSTQAIETPGTPTGAQTSITSATIYFYDAAGAATNYNGTDNSLVMTAADITAAMSTTGSGYIIEKVDAAVAKIEIKANGGESMTGKNVNGYQNAEDTSVPEDFHKFLELAGSADITYDGTSTNPNGDGHKLYKAAVELVPALVRIEVTGGIDAKPVYSLGTEQLQDDSGRLLYEHKAADGTYYNTTSDIEDTAKDAAGYTPTPAYAQIQTGYYAISVEGIYMNNIYLKKGDTAHPWNQQTTAPTWAVAYAAGGTHEKMYDELTAATKTAFGAVTAAGSGNWWLEQIAPADRNNKILDGKAAAYQIFSQLSSAAASEKDALGADLPHVIVKLTIFDTKEDYDAFVADAAANPGRTAYANIRTFLKAGTTKRLTAFEDGKIYKFSLEDLSTEFNKVKFENGNIVEPGPDTPDPDPDTFFDLQVNVTILDWEVVNLTPEL